MPIDQTVNQPVAKPVAKQVVIAAFDFDGTLTQRDTLLRKNG